MKFFEWAFQVHHFHFVIHKISFLILHEVDQSNKELSLFLFLSHIGKYSHFRSLSTSGQLHFVLGTDENTCTIFL